MMKHSNFRANSVIWPEIESVRDFKPVLVTCKLAEDPIKTESAILSVTFVSQRSRADNSEVNGRMWPAFELIRDFMAVLVTCNFVAIQSNRSMWSTYWQATRKAIKSQMN